MYLWWFSTGKQHCVQNRCNFVAWHLVQQMLPLLLLVSCTHCKVFGLCSKWVQVSQRTGSLIKKHLEIFCLKLITNWQTRHFCVGHSHVAIWANVSNHTHHNSENLTLPRPSGILVATWYHLGTKSIWPPVGGKGPHLAGEARSVTVTPKPGMSLDLL